MSQMKILRGVGKEICALCDGFSIKVQDRLLGIGGA
jgi:hypothetical protein